MPDDLMLLSQAVRRIAAARGIKGNAGLGHFWVRSGILIGGSPVRLEAVRVGRQWLTRGEWVERFIAATTPA